MGWGARWGMHTDTLTLMQWLSPAFPTGGFAYSHGLEWAMDQGVTSPALVSAWIADVLRFGSGQSDAVLLARALLPGADFAVLDDLARALCASRERLVETVEQGTAFARTVAALTERDLPARALPVAVGEACAVLALPPGQIVAQYLQAFAANLVAVAVRFVPLGQTDGQRVLTGLQEVIGEVAEAALGGEIGTCALGADMAAMRHETMEVRIFKT
jgi:urease accessory protein